MPGKPESRPTPSKLRYPAISALVFIGTLLSPDKGATGSVHARSSETVQQEPTQEAAVDAEITVSTLAELQKQIYFKTTVTLDESSPEYAQMIAFVQEASEKGMLLDVSESTTEPTAALLESNTALQLKTIVAHVNDGDCFIDVALTEQAGSLRRVIEGGAVTVAAVTTIRAGDTRFPIIVYVPLDDANFDRARILSEGRPDLFRRIDGTKHGVDLVRLASESIEPATTSLICSVVEPTNVPRMSEQIGNQQGPRFVFMSQSLGISSEGAQTLTTSINEQTKQVQSDTLVFLPAGNSGTKLNDFGEAIAVSAISPIVDREKVEMMALSNLAPVLMGGKKYVFAAQGSFVFDGRIVEGTSIASPEFMRQVVEIIQSLTPMQWTAFEEVIKSGATRPEQVAYLLKNYGGREQPMWFYTSGEVTGSHELAVGYAQLLFDGIYTSSTNIVTSATVRMHASRISSRDFDMWGVPEENPEVIVPELQFPTDLTVTPTLARLLESRVNVVVEFQFIDGTRVTIDASPATSARNELQRVVALIGTPSVEITAEDCLYEQYIVLTAGPNTIFVPGVSNDTPIGTSPSP